MQNNNRTFNSSNKRAQGAIEYLLIIGAAILVVAIVVLAMTGGIGVGRTAITGTTGDVNNAYNELRKPLGPQTISLAGDNTVFFTTSTPLATGLPNPPDLSTISRNSSVLSTFHTGSGWLPLLTVQGLYTIHIASGSYDAPIVGVAQANNFNGICGTAAKNNYGALEGFPVGNLCDINTNMPIPSPSTLGSTVGSTSNWDCNGWAGTVSGNKATCTATRSSQQAVVNGACGWLVTHSPYRYDPPCIDAALTGYYWSSPPAAAALCSAGTPSSTPSCPAQNPNGSSAQWSCIGSGGGSTITCTASRNGPATAAVCGSNSTTFNYSDSVYPNGGFCAVGTLSGSTPTFPAQPTTIPTSVSWTCNGLFGGVNIGCGALRLTNGMTLSLLPPASATISIDRGDQGSMLTRCIDGGSDNWVPICVGFKIYSYQTLSGGTRVYSPTSKDVTVCSAQADCPTFVPGDYPNQDNIDIISQWNVPASGNTPSGYRVLIADSSNNYNYDHYIDVTALGYQYMGPFNGSGVTAGSTVTPAAQ